MAATDQLAEEQRPIREGCGLLDRSERGKLALSGAGAAEFLNGQVTNDTLALSAGDGCYAAFLTHKGKMLGDLRILHPANPSDELWLDTERVALQPLFDMVRHFKIGYDVELHKRTLQRGLLSLIGPDARRVAGAAALPPDEHANVQASVAGLAVVLVATDVGVDVLCNAADTPPVRQALEEAGARPVSEATAECLRIERGRPRFGVDMDADTMPQEAGINERAVSLSKGCYVGQETVARLFYRGKPNRYLRGVALGAPGTSGDELHLGERVVGRLGSVTVSPRHGPIGLALVRREVGPGDRVTVGREGLPARVLELPF